MGVGRETGWGLGPWILKILAKKGCFSISRGKKQISPLWPPLEKILGKSPTGPPLEKILPTPMRPWTQPIIFRSLWSAEFTRSRLGAVTL